MLKAKLILTTMAASLVLAGCVSVGPDYQRPALDVPTSLNVAATPGKSAAADYMAWWKAFNDPALNALLDEARANNQDLVL